MGASTSKVICLIMVLLGVESIFKFLFFALRLENVSDRLLPNVSFH